MATDTNKKREATTASIVRYFPWDENTAQMLAYFAEKDLASMVTAWVNRDNHSDPDGHGVAVSLRSTDVDTEDFAEWAGLAAVTAQSMAEQMAADSDTLATVREMVINRTSSGRAKKDAPVKFDPKEVKAFLAKKK